MNEQLNELFGKALDGISRIESICLNEAKSANDGYNANEDEYYLGLCEAYTSIGGMLKDLLESFYADGPDKAPPVNE